MNPTELSSSTDVLIVGAGPAGLMMACQLALRQIPFRIIDKKEQPANYSGALIVHARSLEIFRQMGIAEAAIQKGIIANEIQIVFNGKKSFIVPIGNIGSGLSPFPYLFLLEQSETERLLIKFIRDRGYSVGRKTEFLHFSQDSGEFLSVLKTENGHEETVKSKYLIAADGAHSTIRKQLQIPFEGETHAVSLFVSDCKAETNFPPGQICFSFSDETTAGFFPLPDGSWRIDGAISGELETKSTLTFEDLAGGLAERTRMEVSLHDQLWFSVFRTHQRVAETYGKKRCFLVGDAGHIHSPVGAQGMNTGLQDAYNLAWKLSMVIQGKAGEQLLETYQTERIGIARNIVRYTDWVFNLVTNSNYFIRNFRVRMLPFLLKFSFPLFETHFAIRQSFFLKISGIGIHYRKSPLSFPASSGNFTSQAPQPGYRVPYFAYPGNGSELNIQDQLTGTDFCLLVFTRQTIPEAIIRIAEKYANLISVVHIPFTPEKSLVFNRFGIRNFGFYLVRPDMYIACRSTESEDLENYLRQHFQDFNAATKI